MLPSAIGNTKNKYLLDPLLWPANETLKQEKKKIVRESLYQSHHVHHVFLQIKEVKFLLASLESVLSELKGAH